MTSGVALVALEGQAEPLGPGQTEVPVGQSLMFGNARAMSDIAGRFVGTGDWWGAVSTGDQFLNEQWHRWSTTVTWTDVMVGRFDDDRAEDLVGRHVATGDWWVALGSESESAFTNQRWGRWSAGENTWTDVLVGNFAPAPVPEVPEGAFAASEDPSKSAALNSWVSTLPSFGQRADLRKSAMTDSLLPARRDLADSRMDLLTSVMHELTYLRLAVEDDHVRVPPKPVSEIRRLLRAHEPANWETLRDDQPFDPLPLDAYFSALR